MKSLFSKSDKNIGIIGYWFATNYGGVASYYSLYRQVESLGYNPFFVDNPYAATDKEGADVFSRNFFKNEKFNVAPTYDINNLPELNKKTDTFLLGSDQVLTSFSIRAFGKLFLMDFAEPNKRRIAYSSSCGGDNLDSSPELLKYAQSQLKKFNAVSVREYSAVDLLQKKFDIKADVTVDPIFFTSAREYAKLGEKSETVTGENYLLAYVLDPTPDKKKCLEMISEELGLAPKIALDGRKFTHQKNFEKMDMPDATLPELDFYEWLKYYSHAAYIFTDSFHGAVMSLILNKPCIIYINKGRGYPRFVTLGKMFGIESRMIDNFNALTHQMITQELNFSVINEQISYEIENSSTWLKKSLSLTDKDRAISHHINIKNDCTGCSACYNSCPTHAISMEANDEGFLNPKIDVAKCINCGICTKKCIVLNAKYENDNPLCYAVMANDNIRAVSSSGGVFTVAANYILKKHGYVCGAVFDNKFQVQHLLTNNESNLCNMRGSKYYQSNLNEVFTQIKNQLIAGKYVLFTGMPCQVAGLYSFLGRSYQNLYTIDILCHGISSYKVFEKYRHDVLGNKTLSSLQFKAKKPWGWHAGVNAQFTDGTTYSKIIEEDLYYVAYIQGLSKNTPCGKCLFNRLPRQGDLTIGDFWKIQDFDKSLNDNKGTSVVLINNKHGQELFSQIRQDFPVSHQVPLDYAIAGNGIIKHPYALNQNRKMFFDQLDSVNFSVLTNKYRRKNPDQFLNVLSKYEREYYFIAEIINQHKKDRRLVFWGDNPSFRAFLSKYYGIDVEFVLTIDPKNVNNTSIKLFDEIKNKAADYYVVVMGKSFSLADYQKFLEYGFKPINDFIYRMINPIIINNYDLSKGYSDIFGNRIAKSNGIVKRIILRGYNNHIIIKPNVWNLNNLIIDLSANSSVSIDSHANFTQPNTRIETKGYDGTAKVSIGYGCIFMDTLFRLFVHKNESSILINKNTTFGEQMSLRANQGKKIIIGKDCMFSSQIELLAGDGHTIIDLKTSQPINLFGEPGNFKNHIVLGNHVWVGYRSFIMAGTNIGDGSIIGAQSVVKGRFPNNCSIAGSPAKLIRNDIAWSRDMITTDINRCGGYISITSQANPSISGQNVLVIGGTHANGIKLVERLLELGNNVTIATRGKTPDFFGDNINRVKLDVTDYESVKTAIGGKHFDFIFDNLAYAAKNVKNILSNVKCQKYIQLSSIAVYAMRKINLTENDFDYSHVTIDDDLTINNHYAKEYWLGKRQAEAMAYRLHPNTVTVRIPYVAKTDRLKYYCQCIIENKPMKINDVMASMNFVLDAEVGNFLPWIAAQNYSGAINLANTGSVTINDIIKYIEKKTGQRAILDNENGLPSPFNEKSFSLNLDKIKELDYKPLPIEKWFWNIIDEYIAELLK